MSDWQPIETAPEVKGKYFFCRLAYGPDGDQSTSDGFRWNGRWFAAPVFYKSAPHDECQSEFRQIEVLPTHWMPTPAPPATLEHTAAAAAEGGMDRG